MNRKPKYPAREALAVIDGALKEELNIHRFDALGRSKAQLFAIGGPHGRQFAIVVGNTDVSTGDHPAKQTRILFERCDLPSLAGIYNDGELYDGSRIKDQQDSNLAIPNQTSCLVEDASSLMELLRWYAGKKAGSQAGSQGKPPVDVLEQTRVEKAAADGGFDHTPVREGNWLVFRSTAFPFILGVALQPEGAYRVGFSDRQWGQKTASDCSHPVVMQEGPWTVLIDALSGYEALHQLVCRAGSLGRLLAGGGLKQFKGTSKKLTASTEAERLVVQRVGQDIFRDNLIDYWQGRCAVTGLDVVKLLRASHIKPWADCDTDAERLDVFNGLLLAPHLDALFDGGWITFDDGGELLVSDTLGVTHRNTLGITPNWRISNLTDKHRDYLAYHRGNVFQG